jgi:glycosyltransferase involved in cell wall biosynthesis
MSSSLPRVTIVTPSYNQAEFLEATIVSVLSQDYPNLEYMVVDGGSTDGSVSIIEKYADRLACWISERDSGQSSAINKGWQRATGEIVAYLNSDDTYLPGAIRTAVEFMTAHPDVGIAYGDCLAIDERGNTIEKYQASPFDLDETIRRCRTPIPQPGAFIRANVLHTIGLLDESLHMAMDFDLWLRTALRYRLEYLPVTLATYRLHPASKSRSQGATTGPDVIRIYQKLLENPAFPERLRRRPRTVLSSAYLRAADEYYAAVRLRDARASWLRAWMLYPPSLGPREYLAIVNTWLRPIRRRLSGEPSSSTPASRSLTVFVAFRVELWRGARHWAGVSMVEGLARAGHRVVLFIRPDWLRNPIFAHLRGLGVEVRHPGHTFVGLSVTYRKVTKVIQILARSIWRRQPFAVSRRELIVRDGRELEYWWLRRQLAKAARLGRPHVVHAFGATKWTATGVEWAAAQRVPIVYTETQQVGEPEYTSILESFVHRCTAITIHGSRILEGFRRIGYTGPYKVVPFGIPSPDASPAGGANNGRVVIGSASRYDPDKGLGFLIDAFSTVQRQFPDVRLVLAGEGPERERFRGQVASLGLERAVDIREPYDLEHGLPRFMSDIDIYCLPSLREGQPVSIIEAMAFGKPVVASDVGSVAELLDGDVGIVSPAGDSASLATALRRLVEDPELRSAMGRRARERYIDRHRSETVADAYLELYESLGVTCQT